MIELISDQWVQDLKLNLSAIDRAKKYYQETEQAGKKLVVVVSNLSFVTANLGEQVWRLAINLVRMQVKCILIRSCVLL